MNFFHFLLSTLRLPFSLKIVAYVDNIGANQTNSDWSIDMKSMDQYLPLLSNNSPAAVASMASVFGTMYAS